MDLKDRGKSWWPKHAHGLGDFLLSFSHFPSYNSFRKNKEIVFKRQYSFYRCSLVMAWSSIWSLKQKPLWVKLEGITGFVLCSTTQKLCHFRCATKLKKKKIIKLSRHFAELRHTAYPIFHLKQLFPVAPAGSQGQLHSFDVNGRWKPMQSILAHVLISCHGVPSAISIPSCFSWASGTRKATHLVEKRMRK